MNIVFWYKLWEKKGGQTMKKMNWKKLAASLLAVMLLSTSLSGCKRRISEEPTIPDTVDGLSKDEKDENLPGESQKDEQTQKTDNSKEEQSGPDSSNQTSKAEAGLEHSEQQKKTHEKGNVQQQEDRLSGNPQEKVESKNVSTQGLDTRKLGWGPGGPVDENNRPSGAIDYQQKYGKYDADFIKENEKNIYLTFDEGYENGYTDDILDVLKEKNVSAVFFVTMPYVKAEPELIQRMIDEGHVVGNHSVNHLSMPETDAAQCEREVVELHDYVKENFNYEMNLFRFPMGEFSERDLSILQQLGYRSVFWSFAYRDWLVDEQPNPQEALQNIESKCHPGAIYLLHAVSKTNTEILGQMIDDLRAEGYTFCKYE